MKISGRVIASLLAVLVAGGCEGARKAIGLEKAAPDEFSVYTRAPLSLPPITDSGRRRRGATGHRGSTPGT